VLEYDLDAYAKAPSGEGPLAAQWADKPHRLVYDLVAEVRRLRSGFRLEPHHREKLAAWNKEQDAVVAARQREDLQFKHYADLGLLPYYGCVGGALTFHFTPCSIGTTIRVTHQGTKAEIDLTEDDEW
jgi:hypothetical protein